MEEKINELLDVMDDRDWVDVVCVNETEWKHKDTTDLPDSRVAFWAGLPESERACQGVGIGVGLRYYPIIWLFWL